MKPLLLLPLLAIAVSAQSQSIPCGSPPAIAANPVPSGSTSAFAAQIRRRPPAIQPSFSCRCGMVGASSLTAQTNSQEVPILNGLAGSFRFDHVLLRETTRFSSDSAGSLVVGVGRPTLGPDVVSPVPLKSDSAPYSFWYERPAPPQLTGAYDLVLNFKASAPLGDGAVSNFSAGAVTWEVCGYNAPPAP
jgi:hypothetical protein